MNIQSVFSLVNIFTLCILFFSIIYTTGIVWRVEKKLDTSYKFFLMAIIFIFAAETLDLFFVSENTHWPILTVKIFHLLFAICFLVGILFMRDIVRKLDGEK